MADKKMVKVDMADLQSQWEAKPDTVAVSKTVIPFDRNVGGLIMNDLVRWKALFDAFGIGYEEFLFGTDVCLELRVGDHNKVTGYSGFATTYHFDESGKFKNIEVWE